mmetsp:Transcript_20815/g.31005  ORF Transcript_20815/g.31005 Transcript_20815/m.31005 type:complete len:191 (+) Transcript_20815:203-775(+)
MNPLILHHNLEAMMHKVVGNTKQKKKSKDMSANQKIDDYNITVVQSDTISVAGKKEIILMKGFLMKKPTSGFKWSRRYFVLRKKPSLELAYYDKEYDEKRRKPEPKNRIATEFISAIKPSSKKQFSIEIQSTSGTWIVQASSEEERQKWLHHLRSVLALVEDDELSLHGADATTTSNNMMGFGSGDQSGF